MQDVELRMVFDAIEALDYTGDRFNWVIRSTYDQLYDGQRTGRFRWNQLLKTEKTHFGTLVQINVQREFWFANGDKLDYSIEGIDVDCKFSERRGGWMIPPEAHGRLCLVITASDTESVFSVGLVRARPEHLNLGRNRDAKASLSAAGMASVQWLHYRRPLTENLLLHLPEDVLYEVVGRYPGDRNGQRRVNALFRLVQQRVVTRTVVATVAQQDDYMKRVRGNGGARSHLRPEGIVILGDYAAHCAIARGLGITEPTAGGFVSVRLAPGDGRGRGQVELDGWWWRVAGPDDPVVEAPLLPDVRKRASRD